MLLLLLYVLIPLLLAVPGLVGCILLLLVLLLMLLVLLSQLGLLSSCAYSSLHLQIRTGAACSLPALHDVPLRVVRRRVCAVVRRCGRCGALEGRCKLAAGASTALNK
jgi:hypothetical protein